MLPLAAIDIHGLLNSPFLGLDVKSWVIIAVIAFLAFSGKIDLKSLWNSIFGPKPGPTPPGPGPLPGPTPAPGFDWSQLIQQLLFQLFMKAEATGDAKLKESVSTITAHLNMGTSAFINPGLPLVNMRVPPTVQASATLEPNPQARQP